MAIIIENWTLYPERLSPGKFNLYKTITIQKGKKVGDEKEVAQAYGVSISRAIEIISEHNVWTKSKKLSLYKYLKEKGKEVSRLLTLFEDLVIKHNIH